MKIKRRGYETLLSADEKILFLVAGSVFAFDISGEKAVEWKRFNNLKNPDNISVSTDGRLIAYSNTSGHIAVHDLETGELLVKSKCTSREGKGLYFIRNNRQILSSDGDGNVFTLDVESGEFTVVSKFPFSCCCTKICPVSDNKFIVFGNEIMGYTRLFELFIAKTITWNELYAIPPYCTHNAFAVANEKIYICADAFEGDMSRLNAHMIYSDILVFNSRTKELSKCIQIEGLLELTNHMVYKYGGVNCMCISKDEKTLLLGTREKIIGIDLAKKKLLGIREVRYLSNLRFMASDTKVVIGTWENVEIVDFDTMFFCDR